MLVHNQCARKVKPSKTLTQKPFSAEEMEFGCEIVAENVQKEIGGQLYRVTSNARSLGPVHYDGGTVVGWNNHVAVIKDSIVYDGLTGSNGMPEELYKLMFEYNDVLTFVVEK